MSTSTGIWIRSTSLDYWWKIMEQLNYNKTNKILEMETTRRLAKNQANGLLTFDP